MKPSEYFVDKLKEPRDRDWEKASREISGRG